MSVLVGFIILVMLLFLFYMSHRLYQRRELPFLIVLCLQIFALTLSIFSFFNNVSIQNSNIIQTCYIFLGIIAPCLLILYENKSYLIEEARKHGVYRGIIRRLLKSDEKEECMESKENYYQLLNYYKIQIRRNPSNYKLHDSIGTCYYNLGQKDDALKAYRKAVQLNPESFRSWYNIAVILDEIGRSEDAVKSLKKVIELKEDFIDAYNNLAIIYSTTGRYNEAIQTYADGLEKNPGEYSLFFNMGITLSDMGKFEEAVEVFHKAMDIKTNDYELYFHFGAALTQLGKYDEALKAYKCGIEFKPEDSEILYNIATIYSMLGNYEIAIENLRKAIELNNNLKKAANENEAFDSIRNNDEFKNLVS